MENTIPAVSICNRKIIIEIRYSAIPIIIDKRGELLNKLNHKSIIPNSHWELGTGEVKMFDSVNQEDARIVLFADLKKLTIISTKISSNDSFFQLIDKAYKTLKEVVGDVDILRVGCRIIGTYKAKSKEYITILQGFKDMFPSQILLEDFQVKDLRLQLNYQNGMYNIGPINKNDEFLKTQFPYDECDNSVGFGIDTDNFILKPAIGAKISDSNIKDVIITSLSVEKSLFEKISTL
ncbi:MAG: hypothetical protein H7Z76_05655 [Methylotenera sp.]|nr:hypothetical protein [Flavobacterium sp.]